MNKQEFLTLLRERLCGLPQEEIEERLTFYSEMIDDRMEEGLSEARAVAAVGDVEDIFSQIVAEIPFAKIAKERMKRKRRLKTWEIVLLALGSPVWFSLLIAAVAVVFSLYVSLWSVIVSLWSVFASLAACAVGGVLSCVVFVIDSSVPTGVAMLAAGLVCAGLCVFAFYGCAAATKGILLLTKKMTVWIKNGFIKKEGA